MISAHRVKKAFGTKTAASEAIGVSRVTIDAWIKNKKIPEMGLKHPYIGKDWHEHIRKLGFNPDDLSPL